MIHNESEDPNIVRSYDAKFNYPIISYGEFFYNTIKKFNDKTLIIDAQTDESLTGKEILIMAETVAVSLLKYITNDDVILFFSENNIQYVITEIASIFLGVTISPSKPSHNVFELRNQINDCGATILFTSVLKVSIINETINSLENKNQIKYSFIFNGNCEGFIPFEDLNQNNSQLSRIPYFSIKTNNDVQSIFYTSGTTGLPKGAMLTHYHIIGGICNYQLTFKYDDVIVCYTPFGHLLGYFTLGYTLLTGATLILMDNNIIENILSAVEKYKVTNLRLFPALCTALIDGSMDNYDLSSVTTMRIGGSSITSHYGYSLIKKYKLSSFMEMYGLTEGFVCVPVNQDYVPGDVGTVESNTQMKIIDLNTGKSLPANQWGEMCFRGPLMFKGYINNPEATASTIDASGWLHTGDVGFYNNEKHIFITDRVKEIVKFQIFSVFPVEVESCLMEHEDIVEAAVIGVKHMTDGQWLRAYVLLKKGEVINAEEIQKYIRDRMAFQKELRAGVVFVDHIPHTITGKIDRKYFKDMCKDEIISDK